MLFIVPFALFLLPSFLLFSYFYLLKCFKIHSRFSNICNPNSTPKIVVNVSRLLN